jgi:predicted DsbA family dithiol-disulfide isomerase
MENLIWEEGVKKRNIDKDRMVELAKKLRLDMTKFNADLESDECIEWLRSSQEELNRVGTNGTPAFYINGRYLSGGQSLPALKRVVDEELAKANKAIDGGVELASYYRTAVLEGGIKELVAEEGAGGADPHAGHGH